MIFSDENLVHCLGKNKMITYLSFLERAFGDMFSQLQLLRLVSVCQSVHYYRVNSLRHCCESVTDLA